MNLYDFIRNDFLKPSPKDEGAEAIAALQKEREAFTAEREMLQYKISALESHFEELKNKRDDLVLQLQAAESDRSSALEREGLHREKSEALAADREKLIGSINTLEKHVATLNRERSDLEMQMQAYVSEKEKALGETAALVTEKSSEVERLRTNISALQKELQETVAGMKRVETEKQTCVNELEKVRKDFSAFMQKTKIAIVIASIVALATIAGFFIYS